MPPHSSTSTPIQGGGHSPESTIQHGQGEATGGSSTGFAGYSNITGNHSTWTTVPGPTGAPDFPTTVGPAHPGHGPNSPPVTGIAIAVVSAVCLAALVFLGATGRIPGLPQKKAKTTKYVELEPFVDDNLPQKEEHPSQIERSTQREAATPQPEETGHRLLTVRQRLTDCVLRRDFAGLQLLLKALGGEFRNVVDAWLPIAPDGRMTLVRASTRWMFRWNWWLLALCR